MPYVEGFGTWPSGEEWLFEAIAGSYLPLLGPLERAGGAITLSLTPVLCDQLEAPGVGERFLAFVREVREESHRQDVAGLREGGHDDLAAELEALPRGLPRRRRALRGDRRRPARGAGPPRRVDLRGHARGAAAGGHRRGCAPPGRAGHRGPSASLRRLARRILAARVRACAVARSAARGGGSPRHLRRPDRRPRPRRARAAAPAAQRGRPDPGARRPRDGGAGLERRRLPGARAYRDYHHHTIHHHRPWSNGGGAYDREAARARPANTPRTSWPAYASACAGGGLCVCALDTELLGHWWHEGPCGSTPCSTRRPRRAWRWRRSTTRSSATSRRPRRASCR